ncbi:hypothetical protein JRQ81_015573 [Phrynocephalus forsythii]|uniref:Uncharacterized protein n=1 Tax=Phrynocephalus forsythii TaxID=171643 RepID=A0A9Q0XW57_9SAUR|nr:hypothetical protein JRQ81_015573 [Phrynocephalus forsythii]
MPHTHKEGLGSYAAPLSTASPRGVPQMDSSSWSLSSNGDTQAWPLPPETLLRPPAPFLSHCRAEVSSTTPVCFPHSPICRSSGQPWLPRGSSEGGAKGFVSPSLSHKALVGAVHAVSALRFHPLAGEAGVEALRGHQVTQEVQQAKEGSQEREEES